MGSLFYGRVLPGGLLVMENAKAYGATSAASPGSTSRLLSGKRQQKRSQQANRFLLGLRAHRDCRRLRLFTEEAHDALKYHFLRETATGRW
jgi:hypothetical protein